ncbi:MAG: protein kinase, partial [Chloroflexota bacterium]
MSLEGKTVGKYQLVETMGSGGMAEVYKGFEPRLERTVAIKVMHDHLAKSPDFRERFLREAKAIARLNHPNVVGLIDFDSQDRDYYMVMEFIEGGTLEELLKEEADRPSLEEVFNIMSQVASGLEYAHQQGMIHRDIKPANIMFHDRSRRRVVITDFGIARLMDEAGMTMSGTMLGTPHYMAPEIVKGEQADPRSDIYSMGVVLYELVTGQPPFEAETPYGVMVKQANEPMPSPREINPDLSYELEEVIAKALEKNREDRFQSAAEFSEALRMLPEQDPTVRMPPAMRGGASAASAPKISQPVLTGTGVSHQNAADQSNETDAEPSALRKFMPLIGAVVGVLLIGILTVFLLSRFGENDSGGDGAGTPVAVGNAPTGTSEAAPTEAAAAVVPTDTPEPQPEPTEPESFEPTSTQIPPTETSEPSPTVPPVLAFDFVEQPAYVCNIGFLTDADILGGLVTLKLEDVKAPIDGELLFAWLGDGTTFTNLGPAEIDAQGQVNLRQIVGLSAVDSFDRFILSSEVPDAVADFPQKIIMEGVIDPDVYTSQRQFVANLADSRGQYGLAIQHAELSAQGLAANDLDEARKHAEHVVNILEGSNGAFFGDLDGSGLAENPGDGTGALNHLLFGNEILDLAQPIDPNSPIAFAEERIDSGMSLTFSQAEIGRDQALRLLAVDSVEEGGPVIESLLN